MALEYMIVEQTSAYQKRMKYQPQTDSFIETQGDSLGFRKNVPYPYGWLKGYGTPPERHLDILLLSAKEYQLGETVAVKMVGVFIRNDGDNKLVAVLPERFETEYAQLPDQEREQLLRLYPGKYEGEGWFGLDKAKEMIRQFTE